MHKPSDAMLFLTTLAAASLLPETIEISPGVAMPRINLGTCCGSEVANAFPIWWASGGRGVDTAFDYGKEVPGGKQTELASAIDQVGAAREDIFITTKIRAGLDPLHGLKACVGLSADYAYQAVLADLAELNVSQVDLVLLHAPCKSDATNAKLWKGLEQALAQNLTRAIGVSNFPKAQLAALLAQSTTKPSVQQCQMSMAEQEEEMLQYCSEQGITFEAYGAMRGCPFDDSEVQGVAAAHGVDVARVCLRWILQKGAIFAAGLGSNVSTMPAYAEDNLGLYGFELSVDEMKTLDAKGEQIGSCEQGY